MHRAPIFLRRLLIHRCPAIALALVVLLVPAVPVAADPLDAVVGVRASVPRDARSAQTLGTTREGSGVVIDDSGLVLTIGYLVMESSQVEIEFRGGRKLPAQVAAYDYDSGFGLLRPATPVAVPPVPLGESNSIEARSPVLVVSFGSRAEPTAAYVTSRRDFAGYWEYLLPNAIFTAPPHMHFGGAALFDEQGRLLGIGSLIVGDSMGTGRLLPGNMFIPIDALKPILSDLLTHGRAAGPARPWLGVYTSELRGHVVINRVAPEGPAAAAGLVADDLIVAVGGETVTGQADFYRKLWALGEAGVDVPLTVLRRDGLAEITVTSGDRYDFLRMSPSL